MKKLFALLLAVMMVVSLAACSSSPEASSSSTSSAASTAPTETTPSSAPTQPTVPSDVTSVGEGKLSFNFEVVDADGTVAKFLVKTDADNVGKALLDNGLVDGTQSDWGLYVTAVNGVSADWNTERSYWAFYINGEYAMTGVDATEITDGATYSFVKTCEATVVGEGSSSFLFLVKVPSNPENDVEFFETAFLVKTDATTVGKALLDNKLVEGSQSDWGLYVTAVNGVSADWNTERSYWAFYINDEYAMTGVDATEIASGNVYSFVKTCEATIVGEGNTSFLFLVKDTDNSETAFLVKTDATTVGEALVDNKLVEGTDSEWGLYVTTVNGITADWDAEQTYWAFYIDGEYAMTGVDATNVVSGAVYSFVKTAG